MELICSNCQENYDGYKDKRTKNNFCSKSCAAKFNNKKFPKRKLTKKCKECKSLISYGRKYCGNCIEQGKHLTGKPVTLSRTIESMINGRTDANRFTNIRKHASLQVRDRKQECAICKYKKHVENCHVKDIASWPLTATLREVNDPRNLILLCRNCHWELDHDCLEVDINKYLYQV